MKAENKKLLLVGIFFFLCGSLFSYLLFSAYLKTDVTALPDRAYFSHLHPLLSNAERSIHVVMFTIRYYPEYNDSSVNELLAALVAARKRGLEVKVIMEGGEDFLGADFTEQQKGACRFLQEAGIEIRFDPRGIDTHTKLIIVDDVVVLGSTNWNYYALEQNHEASAAITSKLFTGIYENYFWNLWRSSLEAQCQPGEEQTVTIAEIFQNRDYYDGRRIILTGTVSAIKARTSKAGNDYATFTLTSERKSLRVFTFGHPEISASQKVTVKGTYHKEKIVSGYTYYDEIEATEITAL